MDKSKLKTYFYFIDDQKISFSVLGNVSCGVDTVLIDNECDLVDGLFWEKDGYTVQPFLNEELLDSLRCFLWDYMSCELKNLGLDVPKEFRLKNYHAIPGLTQDIHLNLVKTMQYFLVNNHKELGFDLILEKISEIMGHQLTPESAFTPSVFHFRIVRPGSFDFNPPHKDVWIPRLKHAVNIYVPLCGSNKLSSLSLLPGSQWLSEKSISKSLPGAKINGINYTVPAVVQVNQREFKLIRPIVNQNEVLVFSPYMIHGGAANFGDETRVSLEMRFWKKS